MVKLMQMSSISKMETLFLGKLSRLNATYSLHIQPALPQQATKIAEKMLCIGLQVLMVAILI